ncbi:MAG: ribosome maturation factor RimP [Gemmatimonadetes bacterium]|nr:ribosome maturation factor RimP [Gemmatimonadota bacterium]
MRESGLERELEERVDRLGFELVDMERAGSANRPILRLRIDRPDSTPESGVTLEDCTHVSRALEAYLDEQETELGSRYVLEVSSPGVERPLVRRRDWERFHGREVALHGKSALAGRSRRLEGTLLGLVGEEGAEGEQGERVVVRLADGEEVEVPRAEITRAHLVHRWGGEKRSS